ncbi:MAG: gliding motility-associated C-terminal domain-containing protein [Chitinophagales bacterium]|nr:gliding motility-associated C-terminal domain-containing protein [Chitinophagales bacterium]
MKKFIYFITVSMIALIGYDVQAQCPTLYDLKVNGTESTSVCVPGKVELSVHGIQMPSGGTIDWYYSEDENFDPKTQGNKIGTTNLPTYNQQSCPQVCPDLLMMMINSCDQDGLGVGMEHDNEFFIFSSGSGFFASDLQFKINEGTNDNGNDNHSINIGSNPCSIKNPSDALMTRLRTGACSNLNLFPAGPGDFIPSDALVIFYMSANVAMDYDLTTLCGSGHNVYVMQNACQRTMGAFTNSKTSNDSYRYNALSLKNCTKCVDSLNYNRNGMKDLEGEYAIDNEFNFASVANGSIILNDPLKPCQTPDLSNYIKPNEPYKIDFEVKSGSPLCGKTVYFKAYVTPSDEAICKEVIAKGASLNILCGGGTVQVESYPATVCSGNAIDIVLGNSGDYSWVVEAPNSVTGLSNGSGTSIKSINQTPVYNGNSAVKVKYTISSLSQECPVDPVTIEILVGANVDATITGETQLCSGGSTTLSVQAQNGTTVLWSNGATSNSINVSQSGNYSVVVSNGACSDTAQVEVVIGNELKPSIVGKSSICDGESTTLSVAETFDSYSWSNGEQTQSITVNKAGVYTVTVTNGACQGTASLEVTIGANYEVIENSTPVSCAGNDGTASIEVKDVQNYTVLWSSGDTSRTITNKSAGDYSYTITVGTCTQSGSVSISVDENVLQAEFVVEPVPCGEGADGGSISISNIKNEAQPIVVLFNGNISTETSWSGLSVGDYEISITDAKGCVFTTTLSITDAPQVSVVLPQDVVITQGQQVNIQATITGVDLKPEHTIYHWTPTDGLSCSDCPNPTAKPQETTLYVLSVENAFGCVGEDSILIEVQPVVKTFLPSAFSPNGDGKNDILYILSNVDAQVKIFEIFNRWGQSVYRVENVPTNLPSVGWDGTFKGKKAPLDNYSYYYEVTLPDNSSIKNKGAILIIR